MIDRLETTKAADSATEPFNQNKEAERDSGEVQTWRDGQGRTRGGC